MRVAVIMQTLLIFLQLGSAWCGPCRPQYRPGRHLVQYSSPKIGGHRQWLLIVPDELQPHPPAVVMLHGMGSTPYWTDAMANMSSTLQARHWLGLLPFGMARVTHPGATACCVSGCDASCCTNPLTTGGDGNHTCGWDVTGHPGHGGDLGTAHDVDFLRFIARWAASDMCADPSHIFLAGFSAGAMMANRMGCEASDVFAGVGIQAGNAMRPCANQSRPVPFLEIDGTADPTYPSFYKNVYNWSQRNGCDVKAPSNSSSEAYRRSVEKNSRLVFSSETSHCFELSECTAATHYCTVSGLEHHWSGHVEPGCPGASWCSPRGVLPGDIDATDAIFFFFETSILHIPTWI
eukprot:TRINITY_DN75709_c0_g1_i1.p1 TRINITY_DN75709_c0_g1~~TRINITY_DN75709_c0_g1_i1.p1  ORF type:complete len:348 (+),score=35.72 TRINITY_DN75709_c0_g1_i1:71-1114(+)